MLRSGVLALVLLIAVGCSNTAGPLPAGHGAPGMATLPAPAEALRSASAVDGGRELDGAQYDAALPSQGVSAAGTGLQLLGGSDGDFGSLAYALFALDTSGYDGAQELDLKWQGGAPPNGVWLGLANWSANRWDWQAAPAGQAAVPDYAPYIDSDGRILVALLSMSQLSCTLEQVSFGTWPLDPPTGLQSSWDSAPPVKLTLSWDAPADGPAPDSYSVWRSASPSGPYGKLADIPGTTFIDADVQGGAQYWYKVRSEKDGTDGSGYCTMQAMGGPEWHFHAFEAGMGMLNADMGDADVAVVDGLPTLAFCLPLNNDSAMQFVRAEDAYGDSWQAPIVVDENLSYARLLMGSDGSVGVLDNNRFLSTPDPFGSTWNEPAAMPGFQMDFHTKFLTTLNGKPFMYEAEVAMDNTAAWCVKGTGADNAAGSSWSGGMQLMSPDTFCAIESVTPPLFIDGTLTIFFATTDVYDEGGRDAKIYMITPVAGDWSAVEQFDLSPDANVFIEDSAAVEVDGRPALFMALFQSWSGGSRQVVFTRKLESGAWTAPQILDQVSNTSWINELSAATVDGKPALAYDAGMVAKYLEAADAEGSSWNDPLTLEEQVGSVYKLRTLGAGTAPAVIYSDSNAQVKLAIRH